MRDWNHMRDITHLYPMIQPKQAQNNAQHTKINFIYIRQQSTIYIIMASLW